MLQNLLKWCFGIAFTLAVLLGRQGIVLAAEYESIIFEVVAEEAGYHHISVHYMAVLGGGDILREVRINGEIAPGAEVITFSRFFVDENQDWMYQQGNQLFPTQVEVERAVHFTLAVNTAMYIPFWLNAGTNTIEFLELEGEMLILEPPTVTLATPRISYAEYLQLHSGASRYSGAMIVRQAQHAMYKTSRSLFPVNERACPLVTP